MAHATDGAAENLLERGIDASRSGRSDLAVQYIEQALTAEPNDADAHQFLGRVLAFQGRLEEAENHLRTALNLDPDAHEIYLDLAQVLRQRGLHTALDVCIKGLKADPKLAEAHYTAANLLCDLGRYEEARDHYRVALKLKPDYDEAHNKLGDLLMQQGRLSEAAAQFRKAANAWPKDEQFHQSLRQTYSRMIPIWHFEMLNDGERNNAYERAIARAVAELDEDALVLDIGTGSGLLSMMAARAGARNVVACEMVKPLARVAEKIVAQNGYADRIRVVPKKSTRLELGRDLPAPASLVINELFDYRLLGGGVLLTMQHAVSNLMAPDCIVLPAAATVWGEVVECPTWRAVNPVGEVAGFDLSAFELFRDPAANLPFDLERQPYRSLTEPFRVARIDFRAPTSGTVVRRLRLTAKQSGAGHAVAFWWELHLDSEITYSNRSTSPLNHWWQAIHFLGRDLKLEAGRNFDLDAGHADTRFIFRNVD